MNARLPIPLALALLSCAPPPATSAGPAAPPSTSGAIGADDTTTERLAQGDRVFFLRTTSLAVVPEGEALGRAFAGAEAEVVELRPDGLWLRLPVFERHSAERYVPGETPIVVQVPRDAVATSMAAQDRKAAAVSDLAVEQVALSGTAVEDHQRDLQLRPGDVDGASLPLRCGTSRIVEERRIDGETWQRVAQIRERIEVVGWTDHPIRTQQGHPCGQTRLYRRDMEAGVAVPSTFVAVTDGLDARDLLDKYRFFVELDAEGAPLCRAFEPRGDALVVGPYVDDAAFRGRTVERRYRLSTQGASVELLGPEIATIDGERRLRSRCGHVFTFVGADGERATLLDFGSDVVAYREGAAAHLFVTKQACDEAVASLALGQRVEPSRRTLPLFGC